MTITEEVSFTRGRYITYESTRTSTLDVMKIGGIFIRIPKTDVTLFHLQSYHKVFYKVADFSSKRLNRADLIFKSQSRIQSLPIRVDYLFIC